MLAHYVGWHLRQRLAPPPLEDDDRAGAKARRRSPVEPAKVPERAQARADRRRAADGPPVHGLRTLLDDLSTLTLNQMAVPGSPGADVVLTSRPTPVQERAFELLRTSPAAYSAVTG